MSTVARFFQPIQWPLGKKIAIDLDGGEHPWFDWMSKMLGLPFTTPNEGARGIISLLTLVSSIVMVISQGKSLVWLGKFPPFELSEYIMHNGWYT